MPIKIKKAHDLNISHCNLCGDPATYEICLEGGYQGFIGPVWDVVCDFHAHAVKESDFSKKGIGGLKNIIYGTPPKQETTRTAFDIRK